MMPSIDRWVIRHTLQALAQHLITPGALPLHTCAINLSGTSLGDDSLLKYIRTTLTESGLDPALLCFEITETSAISHLPNAVRLMKELQQRLGLPTPRYAHLPLVLDDDGRKLRETDPATPMYYNKDGGKKYHTTARCASVKSRYLPLSAITYGDLSSYPYNQLSPCTTCGAPERPEVVAAWNSVIDEAYDELGLTP